MMAKASDKPVLTNSISFSVAKYNEVEYARRVAELYRTNHHEFHVTPEAIRVIEKLAWHYDEPFADSSAVPTYYVSETARRQVTVALSGDGGDENFAGYRRYWFDMRENFVRDLVPGPLRRPLFTGLGRFVPEGRLSAAGLPGQGVSLERRSRSGRRVLLLGRRLRRRR